MSKLGDAVSWNRKKKEEYGLGGVDAAKPKSHFGRGTGTTSGGASLFPYSDRETGQSGRDLRSLSRGTGPTPTLSHDKQLGSQGRQPKVEPASTYAAAAQDSEWRSPQNVGAAAHSGPSFPSDSFFPTPEVQDQTGVGEKQNRAGRGTGFRSGRGGSFGGTREAPGPTLPAFNGLEQEDERIKQTQARVAEAMSRYEAARKALVQDTLPTYAASAGGRKSFETSPVASSYAASAGALKSREKREREGRLREAGEAYAALPFPSVGERVGLTLSGAGKEYTGSMAQAGKTILFPSYGGIEGRIDELARNEEEKEKLLDLANRAREKTSKYAQGMQDFADRASESGARDIARAQDGLDPMGKMLVKAGAAVTQMGGDAAVALATGGSSMLPMLTRSFGGGVREGREKGYGEGQQVLLGLANAATEYFSERLFGGNPVYDTDVGLVNRLVGKLVKNPKVMEFLSSAPVEKITEGLEEIVSDLLNPIAEWAITGTRPEYELDQIIEDGIVGVIAAVMAGGGSKVINKVTNLVSDATADKMLLERTTVDFLRRKGDLKLNKKMTQEQKRAALRQAVNQIVEKKKESTLLKGSDSDIIKADEFTIGVGVGAKAKNYEVLDTRTGISYQFVEGTRVKDPTVFAGYRGPKPLYADTVAGLVEEFGGEPDKWQHVKGIGILDVDGEEIMAEIHWFQEESVGKVKFKIKEWRYN